MIIRKTNPPRQAETVGLCPAVVVLYRGVGSCDWPGVCGSLVLPSLVVSLLPLTRLLVGLGRCVALPCHRSAEVVVWGGFWHLLLFSFPSLGQVSSVRRSETLRGWPVWPGASACHPSVCWGHVLFPACLSKELLACWEVEPWGSAGGAPLCLAHPPISMHATIARLLAGTGVLLQLNA